MRFADNDSISDFQIVKRILTQATPFVFNRLGEVGSDYLIFQWFSSLGRNWLAAAGIVNPVMAITRGVNAVILYATAPKVRKINQDPNAVSSVVRRSWLLAAFLGLAGATMASLSGFLFKGLREPEAAVEIAQNFLWAYSAGLIPILSVVSDQQTVLGLEKPYWVLGMTLLMNPLILALGYPLAFNGGLKEIGFGLAYSVVGLLHHLAYIGLFKKIFKLGGLCRRPDCSLLEETGSLAKTGSWGGLYAFFELGGNVTTALLLGRGKNGDQVLGYWLPSQLYSSIFGNLTYAYGHSVGISVNKSKEAKRDREAGRIGNIGIGLGLVLFFVLIILFLISPNLLLRPFLGDDCSALARNFLLITLLSLFPDILRNVGSGNLRGLGDNSFASLTNASVISLTQVSSVIAHAAGASPETIIGIRAGGIATCGMLISGRWWYKSKPVESENVYSPLIRYSAGVRETGGSFFDWLKNCFRSRESESVFILNR